MRDMRKREEWREEEGFNSFDMNLAFFSLHIIKKKNKKKRIAGK